MKVPSCETLYNKCCCLCSCESQNFVRTDWIRDLHTLYNPDPQFSSKKKSNLLLEVRLKFSEVHYDLIVINTYNHIEENE